MYPITIKVLFFLILSTSLFGSHIKQDTLKKPYTLSVSFAPSIEKLVMNEPFSSIWDKKKISLNYGLTFHYNITPRHRIGLGLNIENKGAIENAQISAGLEAFGTADLILRIKYLSFPLTYDYCFFNKDYFSFYSSLGIVNSILIKQTIENTSIGTSRHSNNSILYTGTPPKRIEKIDEINNYFLGINLGIESKIDLNQNFILSFKPYYLIQLNNVWENQAFKGNLLSKGLDFKLGYKF